jgi:hypothetical protein
MNIKKIQNYTDYHKNILVSCDEDLNDLLINQAITYLPSFEDAISGVITSGDWKEYIKLITEYDKFLWECNHLHPQKSNSINILQNKKYSSFRETLLLPLWIRLQNSLLFETKVLINTPVVQTIFSDGDKNMKDADGGLGFVCEINGRKELLPIVVNEDKSGHLCKTSVSNVNGIHKKFEETNPNIIRVCTTDNKVTIGKKSDAELISSINILVSLRKENLNNLTYQSLNPNVFEVLENTLLNRLCDLGTDILDKEKFKVKKKQNKLIRESIDSEGIFINF